MNAVRPDSNPRVPALVYPMKTRQLVCTALAAVCCAFAAADEPAQATRLKAYRISTAAGYNAQARGTAITLFVFDRAEDADDRGEVDAAVREVLSVHRGSEMAMGGDSRMPLASVDTPAQGGLFLWTEGRTDYGSFPWVIPRTRHYVRLRATYVRPPGDDAAVEALKSAMSALSSVARNACDPG